MCTTMILTKGAMASGAMVVTHSDDDELSDQRAHQFDGLSRLHAALKRDSGEFRGIEQADVLAGRLRLLRGHAVRLIAGAVGALAHHQALFVHDSVIAVEIGVGLCDLGDPPDGL